MVMRPIMGSFMRRLLARVRRERPTIVPVSYRTLLSVAPASCQAAAPGALRLSADAGGEVPGTHRAKRRHTPFALLDGDGTARVEHATGGRIERARHLATQHGALSRQLDGGIRDGHGRQKRLRVRVLGILVEGLAIGELDRNGGVRG